MEIIENYDLSLLKDEENKRGFVFIGFKESSNYSLESLANTLKEVGVCDKLPAKILKHKNISIFIFDGAFYAPEFFEFSDNKSIFAMGHWNVMTISELEKEFQKFQN